MAGGRKLEFDKAQALEAAMRVFWKKGYGNASLAELTNSMGINKPSLYASFGNKEALFLQATDHYMESIAQNHYQYLHTENLSLRERLKNYLMSVVRGQCDKDKPKGCYISLCASEAEGDNLPKAALDKVHEVSKQSYDYLSVFLHEDPEAIALGLSDDAEANSLFLITVLNGTAALARAGQSLKELEPVLGRALKGLGLQNDGAE